MLRLATQNRLARRGGIAVLAAALLGLTFYAGYWYSLDTLAAKYETTFVTYSDIARTVVRPGTVVAARENTLRAGASGTVASVLVKAGDSVVAGQTLMRLDNPQLELAGRQAQVSADLARLQFEDVLNQALATRLTAPVAGRVSTVAVEVGDTVQRGSLAAVIDDPGRMAVTVDAPEHLKPGLQSGQPATISVPALGGLTFEGKVSEVGGAIKGPAGKGTVKVEVEFDSNGQVPPGSTVNVALSALGSRRPCDGMVVLPNEGVIRALDKAVITAAPVAEGQKCKAGDVILELSSPSLVAQRDQARIMYDQTRLRYESVQYKYLEGEPALETIRLQFVQAELTWQDLDRRVKALTVAAPYAGRALGLAGGTGKEVVPGDLLVQVIPDDRLMVSVSAPLLDLAWVDAGDQVRVDVPSLNQSNLEGVIVGKTMPVAGQGSTATLLIEVAKAYQPWPGAAARAYLPAKVEQISAPGVASPAEERQVTFGASGTVTAIHVAEGATVDGSQALITLRNESLLKDGMYPAGTGLPADPSVLLQVAGPTLRQAILSIQSSELSFAQKILEREALNVRAAAAGTVTRVTVEEGSVVNSGATLLTMADTSALEVIADVGQADVNHLQLGAQVEVLFPAVSSAPVFAELIEIGQSSQQSSGGPAYPIRLRLPSTPGLLCGMSCVVDIVTDIRPGVPTVPVEAIVDRFGAQAVRVVVDPKKDQQGSVVRESRTWKGAVEWVYVITGVSNGSRVEVLKGVSPGTEIVLREKETTKCPVCGK